MKKFQVRGKVNGELRIDLEAENEADAIDKLRWILLENPNHENMKVIYDQVYDFQTFELDANGSPILRVALP